jgi:hypothetical protein
LDCADAGDESLARLGLSEGEADRDEAGEQRYRHREARPELTHACGSGRLLVDCAAHARHQVLGRLFGGDRANRPDDCA